jgi:hypothetical protein
MQASQAKAIITTTEMHATGEPAATALAGSIASPRTTSPPTGRDASASTVGAAADMLEETLVPFMETTSQCLQNYEQQMAGMQVRNITARQGIKQSCLASLNMCQKGPHTACLFKRCGYLRTCAHH